MDNYLSFFIWIGMNGNLYLASLKEYIRLTLYNYPANLPIYKELNSLSKKKI